MTDTLIARLRLGASISRDRKLNEDYAKVADEAADRIEALQSRLAALEGQDPVAWKYQEATHPEGDLRGRGWRFHQFSMSKPNRPWMQDDVIPLYLAAGAAPNKHDILMQTSSEYRAKAGQNILDAMAAGASGAETKEQT